MTASPCTTCVDATRACPCPAYLRWWDESNPAPAEQGPCLTCTDVEWLLLSGELLEQVAARLGYRALDSLKDHLRRHERRDLLRRSA